jgi:2-polyprenyl-3-methyl-5-hydroxy-6-metoxy-1,4-benzoquinol methylase
MDFLDAKELETNSFDILVMGEVLEHVEQPQLFLERLANLAASDSHIYVTTCINAPAIDHIYLWRNIEELEVMIAAAGLTIRDKLYLPYGGKTLEESRDQNLAINVAYVLGVA